jgi:NADH-quinone oxidoreductase subunit H
MSYALYVIFYGIVLTATAGLFASWVDRKVTARVQYRVGPPLFQPWYDIGKLLGKETVIPAGAARAVFLIAPLVGFAGVILVSTILCVNTFHGGAGFVGDVIVVIYLLLFPSLAGILGAFASGNPLASLGASREIKLILSYELPFALAILVPVIHAGYTFEFGAILQAQAQDGSFAWSVSGALALVVAILCVQAKLALVPFDLPEAETEISGGALIEYSGPGLAIFRLTKGMLLFVLPLFLIVLFLGGIPLQPGPFVAGIIKYVVLLAVITVIRNTNPRVRIDQTLRFFWGPLTIVALGAAGLALVGW